MAINLQTVLNAIQLALTLEPEAAAVVTALVTEVRALFGSEDQATIDAALAQLDAEADAAHASADKLG